MIGGLVALCGAAGKGQEVDAELLWGVRDAQHLVRLLGRQFWSGRVGTDLPLAFGLWALPLGLASGAFQ